MGCGSSMEVTPTKFSFQTTFSKSTTMDNESIYFMNTEFEERVITENIQVFPRKKSASCIQFLSTILMNHFIFYQLTDEVILQIISKMFYCGLKSRDFLYEKQSIPSCFFILESGKCIYDHSLLKRGNTIGELSLMIKSPQLKNVEALEDCYFWALSKTTFTNSLDYIMNKQYSQIKQFIAGQSFYNFLTPMQQDGLAQNMIMMKYGPEQTIVTQGDIADSFIVIQNGKAAAYRGNTLIRYLNPRDSFGEKSLSNQTKRHFTVSSITEVKCLVLTKDKIQKVLGKDVKTQLHYGVIRTILKQLRTPDLEIEKLLNQFKLHSYNNEEFDIQELNDYIVIIVEGQLQSADYEYKKGDIISDIYDDQKFLCTGILAKLLKSKLELDDFVLEESFYEFRRIRPQFNELTNWVQISNNNYGTCYTVLYNNKQYFMRKIDKQKTLQLNLEKSIRQERKILEIMNNPFIANFHQFYSDTNNLYFLFDFVKGKNLLEYLQEQGLLDKNKAQSIISQMILLLEIFHNLSIISREFKPNNFIIDKTGYISMIDFKNSKQSLRTHTIIGNPHYMAPEIIEGKGYSNYSDVWSVGVCLYEFLCGGLPFGENQEDPYKIYEDILSHQLTYPAFYKDSQGKQLINQLLSLNIYQRVGSSFNELKAHKWFTISWDQLYHKNLVLESKQDSALKRLKNIEYFERN